MSICIRLGSLTWLLYLRAILNVQVCQRLYFCEDFDMSKVYALAVYFNVQILIWISLQKSERVFTLESDRFLRWSLFTSRYSSNKHFRTLFPLSLERQFRSIEKQPEISRPSRHFKLSKITFKLSPVSRLRNLKPIFLS